MEETKSMLKIADPRTRQVGGSHYKKFKIEPMQFWAVNNLPGIQASIVKYMSRFRDKGGREDLEKVIHYIDAMIFWHFTAAEVFRVPIWVAEKWVITPQDYCRENNFGDDESTVINIICGATVESGLHSCIEIIHGIMGKEYPSYSAYEDIGEADTSKPSVIDSVTGQWTPEFLKQYILGWGRWLLAPGGTPFRAAALSERWRAIENSLSSIQVRFLKDQVREKELIAELHVEKEKLVDAIEWFKNQDPASRLAWSAFRDAGLLWWINRQLHLFGVSIVATVAQNEIISIRPEFDYKCRGFAEEAEQAGFVQLGRWLSARDLTLGGNEESKG